MSAFVAFYPASTGGGSGVTSLNGLTGALTLVAGANITITPLGSNITIASTAGGGTEAQETPAGLINSANTAFTLANLPIADASVKLYLDGLILEQGVEYTLAGAAITMTAAPLFAQTLYADYQF